VERDAKVNTSQLKVLSSHALFEVLSELGSQFERKSGHRLTCSFDPANVIKRQIEDGAAFDIAIVTKQVIDAMAEQNQISPDSRTDIGHSGLGIAVRKGSPKPDISTVEAFKRTMLAAASVVRSKDGTSGLYFEKLLDRLGIAEAMRGKIKLGGSGRIAETVANGEVEIAVQQESELLPVAGADYVGPFPPELQLYTVFSAGIATKCQHPAAAKVFIDTLVSPSAASTLKIHGLQPIVK